MQEVLLSSFEQELFTYPKFGNGVSFYRLQKALELLGLWEWVLTLPSIKITGTNGKGSTCAMISSILHAFKHRVGRFTSPHLFRFHERICLNQSPLEEEAFLQLYPILRDTLKTLTTQEPEERFGGFEVFFLLALLYFHHKKISTCVAEVGIGGRFDPTRLLPGSVNTLISLDLEHTALLGNSLEAIAYDKMELADPQSTLVMGALPPSLMPRLRAYARLNHLQLSEISQAFSSVQLHRSSPLCFSLKHKDFEIREAEVPLSGRFQLDNAQCALLSTYHFFQSSDTWPGAIPFQEGVQLGFSQTSWLGRFHKIAENPEIFVDVGHTADALRRLQEAVTEDLAGRSILLVLGVSLNKCPILKEILPLAQTVICTQAYHLGEAPEKLQTLIQSLHPQLPLYVYPHLEQALEEAKILAQHKGMSILVAGSLFLAVETMAYLHQISPQSLKFF
jgi:dihydrofolate synthase/folylpolyglutamate synthase